MSNIIETILASNVLKTMGTVIQAVGLANTLAERGPFTIFAPNDEAFSKLSATDLEELFKNIPRLKQLLNYHLVEDRLLVADLMKHSSMQTLQGQRLGIATNNGVKLNQSKLIETDIICDNGIIHILDAVLTLPATSYVKYAYQERA